MISPAKIFGAAFALLAAVLVTVAAVVMSYDYNQLKPVVARMVADATGRELVINGDLHLAVSLTPTLRVEDIVLGNAPWGEAVPMAHLQRLDAKLDLMALLHGQISVDYIVMDGLTLILQSDADHANWEFEVSGAAAVEEAASELALRPTLRDVRLTNADVTYIDTALGRPMHLLLDRADFTAEAYDGPIKASMKATFQGVAVEALAELGSLKHLVESGAEPYPVKLELGAPGLAASVVGTVDQPQAGLGVKARVDAHMTQGAMLGRLLGVALPELGPGVGDVRARANIAGGGSKFALSALEVTAGQSDVSGGVEVDLRGQRPKVTGKLASKALDLDALLGLPPIPKVMSGESAALPLGRPEGEAPRVFGEEPLPFDLLTLADVGVALRADTLKAGGWTVRAITATAQLNAGKLDVAPLGFTFEDGRVEGGLHLDGGGETPTLTWDGRVAGFDPGRLFKLLGDESDLLTLRLDGRVELASQGRSVALLMRYLDGEARFFGRDGRLNDRSIKNLTTGLGAALPWAGQVDAGTITCVVADWPIQGGIATARTVLMDTPGFSVAVTGNVDLGGERLHLTVTPNAKSASLASFAVPMRLKGALSRPYYDVDPKEAVVGTVGNIVKAPISILGDILGLNGTGNKADPGDPCVKALERNGATPAPTPTQAPAAQPAPQAPARPADQPKPQIDEQVKDLGKALQGLFGK